jgi:uncharacterized alpha-E superfamily protein
MELDDPEDAAMQRHWEPILATTDDLELFLKRGDPIDNANVSQFLTFDTRNPSSIFSCILAARENARQIRDQISGEMWEVVNRCYLELRGIDIEAVWNRDPVAFYQRIKEYSHLFRGLTAGTFPHREGLHFIECGQYLERADKTGRILDIKHYLDAGSPPHAETGRDIAQWVCLLHACSGLEAYHQNYVSDIVPEHVAEFLIFSTDFPRSILFSTDRLDEHLHAISGCPRTHYSNEAERLCGRLLSNLKYGNAAELLETGTHPFLRGVQKDLERITLEINRQYMFFPIVDPASGQEQS